LKDIAPSTAEFCDKKDADSFHSLEKEGQKDKREGSESGNSSAKKAKFGRGGENIVLKGASRKRVGFSTNRQKETGVNWQRERGGTTV